MVKKNLVRELIAQFVPALQEASDAVRQRALIDDISVCQNPDQVFNNAHQLKIGCRQLFERRRRIFRVRFCYDVRLRLCSWQSF